MMSKGDPTYAYPVNLATSSRSIPMVSIMAALILLACGDPSGGGPEAEPPLPREDWIASSSSGEGDYAPNLAIDGDMGTRWSSEFTDDEELTIDFGAPREISGVRINWETAYGKDYDILLSTDGEGWEKASEVRWGNGGLDEVFFGARVARFLRIDGVRRGTGWGYSIWELSPIGPEEMPMISASSTTAGAPENVMDGDPSTVWTGGEGEASLDLDLRETRDIGGIEIEWGDDFPAAYSVLVSTDGENFSEAARTEDTDGGGDLIYFARTPARILRISMEGDGPVSIGEVSVKSGDESWDPMRHFEALFTRLPEGALPRWIGREQEFWTIIGVRDDQQEALFSEDGTIEPYKDGFSVMPFLVVDGRVRTARDFIVTQSLEDGFLPLPSVEWSSPAGGVGLIIRALATGEAGASTAIVDYALVNHGSEDASVGLALLVRPLQLNPIWQYGGVSRIDRANFRSSADETTLFVNGHSALVTSDSPTRAGAVPRDEGDIFQFLLAGDFPCDLEAEDDEGVVSAGLLYDLVVPAGESASVTISYPMHPASPAMTQPFDSLLGREAARWRDILSGWEIDCPEPEILSAVRTNLAYMLLNRDYAAAQPGPRNYAKAWMRDGSISTITYLRFGMTDVARGYLDWFGNLVGEDGFVPPLVESGNAEIPGWARDWDEYDAQGEFIFAVRQYWEYTHDRRFLEEFYPKAVRALAFQRGLIEERMTPEYEGTEYFGILPESNSHEGYFPAKHSYWDDFWGLRGYEDGIALAVAAGDEETRDRLIGERDEFRTNLYASLRAVIERDDLDYLPGCAELGDFDVTSTSIAIMACGEGPHLLADDLLSSKLLSGYDRYYEGLGPRLTGGEWRSYTPYEVRNAEALVRLGRRDDGMRLLRYFVQGAGDPHSWSEPGGPPMRPRAWNHMAEVVHFDPRTGSYIGDMPHTWVGAGLINAVRDAFLYEEDGRIVLGAGIIGEWLDEGVSVSDMPTWYGTVSYSARRPEGTPGGIDLTLGGDASPPGGFLLRLPAEEGETITVNGTNLVADEDGVVLIPSR